MLHPNTKIQFINEEMGYGIFAKTLIPAGTITFIPDDLDLAFENGNIEKYPTILKNSIEKYSYVNPKGSYILSWDFGKFVNHNCEPNTMMTGYGFEIAIRDIQPNEQITDEYGLFNIIEPFECGCGSLNCRKTVSANDNNLYNEKWDAILQPILPTIFEVEQVLEALIKPETNDLLIQLKNNPLNYYSVKNLKLNK